MGEEKEENNSRYPKTYVITAAQATQSKEHANEYGEDETKGAPNIPLIENMDNYVEENYGESMILQMQGMDSSEIDMDVFFESRNDVYMNKNKLLRLETTREREKESIGEKIEGIEHKISKLKSELKDVEGGRLEQIAIREERLKSEIEQLEEKFKEIRDAGYFKGLHSKPLNQKCIVVDAIVPPQNVDPTTGRIDLSQTHYENTVIFAHSKQRLRCVPKSIGMKFPRLLMTTGAVTLPNYNTTNSKGDAAEENHKYGFVVVDVLGTKRYLPRIVPANEDGSFVDMGYLYEPDKEKKKIRTEALVLGDIHLGYENPDTMKANFEMMEYFEPRNVILHDALDGHSVNPHEQENKIRRAITFREGKLDIEKEFAYAYEVFINGMAKRFPHTNFYFVYSNHSNEFFERYLENNGFLDEPWNDNDFVAGLRQGFLHEENVVQRGLELIALKDRANKIKGKGLPKNIYCLDLDEGLIIKRNQLGAHGHRGMNGAKGTPKGMLEGYGCGVFGHFHAPSVDKDCAYVGTSSIIPLHYQKGQPGTSMPANAVLYENGLKQLLPIIIGKWNKSI